MADPSERRRDLHGKVEKLSDPEVVVVDQFVDAVVAPIVIHLTEDSWLTTKIWADTFATRLRAHHALSLAPLSTTQFEAAFAAACQSAGWLTETSESATNRFYDIVVTLPGQAAKWLSLKASAAKAMRRGTIHISKLTEAAWIQDVRRQTDRRSAIIKLFQEYRQTTTAIIMLRGFPQANAGTVLYELVEIPTSLFAPIDFLTAHAAKEGTIPIPPGQVPPDLSVRVDHSDAKITVTNIRIEVCIVHGTWTVARQ